MGDFSGHIFQDKMHHILQNMIPWNQTQTLKD